MHERTAPTRPLAVASASPRLEVAHGTAEQLARLAHFAELEQTQPEELDAVAHFLLGRVDDPATVWEQIRDECHALWYLITDDWDDRDLDELTEAEWMRCSFATQQQEVDHRHQLTVARLSHDIEQTVWLARYRAAEARTAAAS